MKHLLRSLKATAEGATRRACFALAETEIWEQSRTVLATSPAASAKHVRRVAPSAVAFKLRTIAFALALAAAPALAVDHDNMDSGRPLDFDDAETIAYRERAIEVGGALFGARGQSNGVAGSAEFLSGFARNWQLNLGVNPQLDRRFDAGNLSASVQHNFNRETENSPAFGARADLFLPTGRDARGLDGRLRGIASRRVGRYGRLHLNADLSFNGNPRAGERALVPGAILGYGVPLGYPTRFDRTLLAQIGYRAAPNKGDDDLFNIGIGLRQQVTVRSVFDIGLKADITGSGASRENFRLIAGYSTAF